MMIRARITKFALLTLASAIAVLNSYGKFVDLAVHNESPNGVVYIIPEGKSFPKSIDEGSFEDEKGYYHIFSEKSVELEEIDENFQVGIYYRDDENAVWVKAFKTDEARQMGKETYSRKIESGDTVKGILAYNFKKSLSRREAPETQEEWFSLGEELILLAAPFSAMSYGSKPEKEVKSKWKFSLNGAEFKEIKGT